MKYPPYLTEQGRGTWEITPTPNIPIVNAVLYTDPLSAMDDKGFRYPISEKGLSAILPFVLYGIVTIPLYRTVVLEFHKLFTVISTSIPADDTPPIRYGDLPIGAILTDGTDTWFCGGVSERLSLLRPDYSARCGGNRRVLMLDAQGMVEYVINRLHYLPEGWEMTKGNENFPRSIPIPDGADIRVLYRVVEDSRPIDIPYPLYQKDEWVYGEEVSLPYRAELTELPQDGSLASSTVISEGTRVKVEVQYIIDGIIHERIWG